MAADSGGVGCPSAPGITAHVLVGYATPGTAVRCQSRQEQASLLLEAVNITPKQVVEKKTRRSTGNRTLKPDHQMDRNWLKGSTGDAFYTLCCAVGYNIKWLMKAIACLGLQGLLLGLDLLTRLRELERNIFKQTNQVPN